MDCIFCNIVQKNTPATLVYEDEHVVAFNDLHPKSPVHILVIPKVHIASLNEAKPDDAQLLGHMLLVVKNLAKENGLAGFKTAINTGKEGGQEVDHLHFHLRGGQKLAVV